MADDNHGNGPPNAKVALAYMAGTPYGKVCGTSDPSVLDELSR